MEMGDAFSRCFRVVLCKEEFIVREFFDPAYNASPRTQVAIGNESYAFGCFLLGLGCLRNYILDEEGITCRVLCIPYRKIKWERIAKIVIYENALSCSTLLVFPECPAPNAAKNQKYDIYFVVRHCLRSYAIPESKKHIHLIEKYWPGEIENKALLDMKGK